MSPENTKSELLAVKFRLGEAYLRRTTTSTCGSRKFNLAVWCNHQLLLEFLV